MKTLVIHPEDVTTSFLAAIYEDLDATVITRKESNSKLKRSIKEHDRIIMLGCGNILEQGSHAELLKNPKGEYRKLVDAQIVKELEKKVDEHEEEQEKIQKE